MRCRPCNPRRTAHGGRAQPIPEPNDHRTTNRHTNGKATTGEAARGPKRAARKGGGEEARREAHPPAGTRTGRTRTSRRHDPQPRRRGSERSETGDNFKALAASTAGATGSRQKRQMQKKTRRKTAGTRLFKTLFSWECAYQPTPSV